MSYKATNWAYELPLRGSAKPVLIALADMADEANSCYPSQDRIAAMTGLAPRTVRRAILRLESNGLLTRTQRHDARGWRTSDRYVLSVGQDLPANLTTGQNDHRPESPSQPATVTAPTGQSGLLTINEPLVEPSDLLSDSEIPTRKASSEDSLFDDIWNLWPSHRRGTRKKSGSSFRTALKAVGGVKNASIIMDAAARHADAWRTWATADERFVPEMTTWLNQERWTASDPERRDQPVRVPNRVGPGNLPDGYEMRGKYLFKHGKPTVGGPYGMTNDQAEAWMTEALAEARARRGA